MWNELCQFLDAMRFLLANGTNALRQASAHRHPLRIEQQECKMMRCAKNVEKTKGEGEGEGEGEVLL